MTVLDVLMPVQSGRFVPQSVLQALNSQGFEIRLFVSTLFQANVALARNDVKRFSESEFVLMLDNDLILPDGGMKSMYVALESNVEFGAIALPRQGYQDEGEYLQVGGHSISEPHHVGMSCVLWRGEVLESLEFRVDDKCECLNACLELRACGVRIGFLYNSGNHCDHAETETAIFAEDMERVSEMRSLMETMTEFVSS